jgi:hypothetical protein
MSKRFYLFKEIAGLQNVFRRRRGGFEHKDSPVNQWLLQFLIFFSSRETMVRDTAHPRRSSP